MKWLHGIISNGFERVKQMEHLRYLLHTSSKWNGQTVQNTDENRHGVLCESGMQCFHVIKTLKLGMSGFCRRRILRRISHPAQNFGSCAELRKIYQMAQKMRKFCWF